ncbi:ornithine cyclodeaminase [Geodermatophilus saharensis]|uniref:Ornithine cyclodeaminase n=1 Tax=Geodermatophilus saharensis TaxID=1137994 RepID=A0A239HRP4_9ACTN|nr:ornithine cyclodeaminase [Geodermatophilus saharensis]SNS83940.1 ornithine cyclodeaminase [Geodermatophilus saharensis]
MTAFVGVRNMLRWVADRGAAEIITGIAGEITTDFLRWDRFDKTPRVAHHTPLGVVELMPVSDGREYSFKYVNGHPANPARGLQTVTAFGVLADMDSGYPVLVSEMTVLTALRTAAMSAVAARALAPPTARTHAMIGAGSQAEFQALALRDALGLERIRVWDVDPRAMAKLAGNLGPLGFHVALAASAADAVAGAEVVTTCTADKALATVLRDEMVVPGVHVNAIGGDCPGKTELDAGILERASVFVEYTPQTRVEGEIQQMPPDFPVTEMWRVLDGTAPGRTRPEEITVFDSVGFAVEDLAALRYLHQDVRGSRYVEDIDLVADPEDPKDLFGLCLSLDPVG